MRRFTQVAKQLHRFGVSELLRRCVPKMSAQKRNLHIRHLVAKFGQIFMTLPAHFSGTN